MQCHTCKSTTEDSSYGPWCSSCGGVVRSDGTFYVRHVATIEGTRQSTRLLFDSSLGDVYTAVVTQPIKQFVIPPGKSEKEGEWKQSVKHLTFHDKTVHGVFMLIRPHITFDDDPTLPTITIASSATPEERQEIEL